MAAEEPQAEATQVRDAAGITDITSPAPAAKEPDGSNMDETLARCVESAVMKGIFGTDVNRRRFLGAVGSSTALAAVSQFFPLEVPFSHFEQYLVIFHRTPQFNKRPLFCISNWN